MAAPCSDDSSTRRSALPSVRPKPRSSGSATSVAMRLRIVAGRHFELVRLDQFLPVLLDHDLEPFLESSCISVGDPGPASRRRRAKSTPVGADASNVKRQTRRRLRGRQPLCGIGVTSRIEVMVKPAACSARSADSRPEPGPETSTSSVRMPCSAPCGRRPRQRSGRRRGSTCASP